MALFSVLRYNCGNHGCSKWKRLLGRLGHRPSAMQDNSPAYLSRILLFYHLFEILLHSLINLIER